MRTCVGWPSRMLLAVPLALAAAGASAQPAAAPVLDRVVRSGELRVATSGRQPPYSATSRSGQLMGFDVELARLLGEALGVDITFVTKPFPALLDTLTTGEADVVISGVAITPERNLRVAFAGPYLLSGTSVLTRSPTLAAARTLAELDRSQVRITTLENSTSEAFVRRFLPATRLTTTRDYDAAVKMLLDDEADALLADEPACQLLLARFPDEGLALVDWQLNLEPIGIAVAPGDPLLLNLLENYLNALETKGTLQALRERWLEDRSWLTDLP